MSDITLLPKPVDGLDIVFGGRTDDLLPAWATIPEEFRGGRGSKWNRVVSQWFYGGLPEGTVFTPKDGIDKSAALRHIGAILGSFQPKHEHKEAGCAYLMSLWFDNVAIPEAK